MTGLAPHEGELREVTAFHEAGHAVAALMRGGSSLLSVNLSDTSHGEGITWHRSPVWDQPFIAYAGPWAEVRHAWGDLPADALDDEGYTFDDLLSACLLFGGGADDADHVVPTLSIDGMAENLGMTVGSDEDEEQLSQLVAATESIWRRELEQAWPVITTVAARLLAGESVTGDQITAALYGE